LRGRGGEKTREIQRASTREISGTKRGGHEFQFFSGERARISGKKINKGGNRVDEKHTLDPMPWRGGRR